MTGILGVIMRYPRKAILWDLKVAPSVSYGVAVGLQLLGPLCGRPTVTSTAPVTASTTSGSAVPGQSNTMEG
jgi:hypothetical protein